MTNREKYAEQILDIACSGRTIAVDKETGKPTLCDDFDCYRCTLSACSNGDDCRSNFRKWCNAEYVELSVDWSKVPVDTPILVRDGENYEWMRRYFAKFDDNRIYAWRDGSTSWTASGNYDVTRWNYAKLAESED